MPGEPIVVQGLWIGPALTALERLSIASFLAQGHAYHLYLYETVAGVPPGATIQDARAILPASMIFRYRQHATYAGFANAFRYKLLLDRGGWWVDTDTVCLRPLEFAAEHVFASERGRGGGIAPCNGILKAPAGSAAMAFLWEESRRRDPGQLSWGETGSRLLAEAIRRHDLGLCLQECAVFSPIPYFEWERVLDPGAACEFPAATRVVHLWNEMWRRSGRDKDANYAPDCLYERWKARYLPGAGPRGAGPGSDHCRVRCADRN